MRLILKDALASQDVTWSTARAWFLTFFALAAFCILKELAALVSSSRNLLFFEIVQNNDAKTIKKA